MSFLCRQESKKPLDENVPSTYKISSHILDHLIKDEAWGWIPGSMPKNPFAESGIWCTDQPSIQSNEISSQSHIHILFWNKSGNIQFTELNQGKPSELFYGFASLPKDNEQATQTTGLTLAAGYRYAPLHASSDGKDPSLSLATNDNILLRSSSSGPESGSHLWTQILGNIFLQNNGPIEQHLVACQSMSSWPGSPLYPYLGDKNL